jgi:hypothetical protein
VMNDILLDQCVYPIGEKFRRGGFGSRARGWLNRKTGNRKTAHWRDAIASWHRCQSWLTPIR